MTGHSHRVRSRVTRAFFGSVPTAKENKKAHGNIAIVSTCDICGMCRTDLVNGKHVQKGIWAEMPKAPEGKLVPLRDQLIASLKKGIR